MKRVFLTLAIVTFCVLTVGAQMVRYPYQSSLKKGDYQEVKKNLDKELKKSPNAVGLNYTAFKLYSEKMYKEYDLEKAYTHLARSWESFKALGGEEKVKAMKNGLTEELYEVNIEFICTTVYEKLKKSNATEEQYDAYLKTYTLAPKSIKEDIASRRDQIRKDETGNSDVEMCNLLKNNPTGDWVTSTREKMYKKAMTGNDVELTECMVSLYKGEDQEKLLGVLHGIYVERDLEKVDELYKKFEGLKSETLKMHQERDVKMQKALKEANGRVTKELINTLAPYNIGVVMMGRYADSLRTKAGWSETQIRKEMDAFKLSYGGNRWYRNYMKVLLDDACVVSTGGGKLNNKNTSDGARLDGARLDGARSVSAVNTKDGKEYSPFIAANDSMLFFVGKGRTDNLGGEDIFVSRREADGSWGKPERLTSLNTEKGNEAVEALTVDGEEMILFKNGRLYRALKHGKNWGKTTPMAELNISKWQADAVFTSDGNALLFAASTKTSREVGESQNIYVSVRDSAGNWSKPIELGSVINTAYDERAPFLHPDMKTLYFSSNGHGAQGSYDIWMSHRKSDKSWTEWTEPVNLGRTINSGENECWYKISTDGMRAYFSKTTPEAKEDLFEIELPASMRPDPVAIIKGRITNKKGAMLDCKIKWEDLETGEIVGWVRSNSVDGSYFVVLPMGKRYGYFVEKEGYYPIANWIDLKNMKTSMTEINDIKMVSIEEMLNENAAVPLNNLFFESGKAELLPESRLELDRVVSLINSVKVKIEISGYTDNRGDKDANQILSENRTRAVRDYLISQGCDYYRFRIIGYGAERPRATNETAEGRQLNRRVELRLVK